MKLYSRLILLLILSPLSAFGFVTVGPDPETCDYDSLFHAYFSTLEHEIRVSNEVLVINNGINFPAIDRLIKGGYANCEDAAIDILELDEDDEVVRSVIDGQDQHTAMRIINHGEERRSITLENLLIQNGNGTASEQAGGLDISGNLSISLNNIRLYGNQG